MRKIKNFLKKRCLQWVKKSKHFIKCLISKKYNTNKVEMLQKPKNEVCEIKYSNDNRIFENFLACKTMLEECIDDIDVISFDVFDTLLLRPFLEPIDSFIYLEQNEKAIGFAEERIAAEHRARNKKASNEVTIDDIYECILPMFKHFKKLELETEKKILYANPFIKEIYSYAVYKKKKIICVSDMYLGSKYITEILSEKGFTDISKIYVSSDYSKSKGTGELFKTVVKDLKIDEERLFHIGDNNISDYQIPKKLKIQAYNIPNIHSYFKNTKWYLNGKSDIRLSILQSIFSECLFYANKEKWSYYRNLGFHLAGPLVLSYLLFTLRICKNNKIDKILFVSRDSYSLMKVYEKLYFSKVGIDYEYVYLQRMIGLKATLDFNDNPCYLKRILEEYKKDGYEIEVSESYDFNKTQYELKRSEIEKWAQINSDELKKHIETVCGSSNCIALVDMTTGEFSSTKYIKKYIDKRLKISFYSGRYSDNWNYFYKSFASEPLHNEDFKNVVLSEMLVSSPEDNVIALKNNEPVYQKCITENRGAVYKEILLGILDFSERYISLFGKDNDDFLFKKFEEWFVLSNHYFNSIDQNDLDFLKSWYHDDLFWEQANTTLINL